MKSKLVVAFSFISLTSQDRYKLSDECNEAPQAALAAPDGAFLFYRAREKKFCKAQPNVMQMRGLRFVNPGKFSKRN